jgi:hypothetical protein
MVFGAEMQVRRSLQSKVHVEIVTRFTDWDEILLATMSQ